MGLVIGFNPRTKFFEIKDSAKNVGLGVNGVRFGVLGAAPTTQADNCGTAATTFSVIGDGSVNLTTLNAALNAIQDKVNSITDVLAAFGLTA